MNLEDNCCINFISNYLDYDLFLLFTGFLTFSFEIFFIFLICIFIYHFLFSVNTKLHNDNFPIEFYSMFSLLFFFIIIYFFFKEPTLLFYTDRWISIESNNIIIKLFLLLQFCILCIL